MPPVHRRIYGIYHNATSKFLSITVCKTLEKSEKVSKLKKYIIFNDELGEYRLN